MENLNLRKLLEKYDGFGKTYYSPFLGDVILDVEHTEEGDSFVFKELNDYLAECPNKTLYDDGCFAPDGELIVFPSKNQRDWNVWAEEQKKIKGEYGLVVDKYYKYNGTIFKCIEIVENEENELDDEYMLQNVISDFVISWRKEVVASGTVNIKPIDKFDTSLLKPYDKTLSRFGREGLWYNTFYGFFLKDDGVYRASSVEWTECIPYNFETANLLGTSLECPEFYNNKNVKE